MRAFLKILVVIPYAVLGFANEGRSAGYILNADAPDGFPRVKNVRSITEGPEHHFFGYYGMPPWDASQHYMVVLQSSFSDRLVEADDAARLILVDLESDEQKMIGTTRAWNFQQGAMVHWLDSLPGRKIIYNDR